VASRLLALAVLLALSTLLASCGAEGTEGLAGPRATVPPVPTLATAPDARSAPVEALVPEGAAVHKVLYGRLLPGNGEQIVVHSSRQISVKDEECPDRQDYLQVFAFDPAFGDWKPLFEADKWPSAAGPLIPDREESGNDCEDYEVLELVELADIERDDGAQELVLGLLTSPDDGAKDDPGPLLLKVLSFRSGAPEVIYDEVTTSGGGARLLPDGRVELEQGTYPSQSGPLWKGRCCANGSLTEVIGWDAEYGQVDVLESTVGLYCRHGAVDEVKDDALIVTCDADGGRRFTGYRLTDRTRVLPAELGGPAGLRVGQEVSVSVAEPLAPDEDWELEPIATEIRVLNQRQATTQPRYPSPNIGTMEHGYTSVPLFRQRATSYRSQTISPSSLSTCASLSWSTLSDEVRSGARKTERGDSPPTRLGWMRRLTSSTRPARRRTPLSVPPLSTRTTFTP